MTRITAIIQARCGSTRLPRKIFRNLSNKPLIWHVIDRLSYSRVIDDVIVATTLNPVDDELVAWCQENSLKYFRGSENDVLSRFYYAAIENKILNILRITADDPFKDPRIIDTIAKVFFSEHLDFAYNNKPPTYPEGLDVEIFSMDALTEAQNNSCDSYEREHMTQFFFRHPEKFRQKNISQKVDQSFYRWTIDTLNDFQMAEAVYSNLYSPEKIFLTEDIIELVNKKEEIYLMNNLEKRSDMYKK